MHWQNGYGHFVLIGSVVSLLGTFECHSWVSEAPLSAQRAALPFAQLGLAGHCRGSVDPSYL
jgi:hypothetical protein